jgi:hypothetical protein
MSQSSTPRLYRVRPAVEHERTVPEHVPVPFFQNRDDAESYARREHLVRDRVMMLEKLAPGGCWLEVAQL